MNVQVDAVRRASVSTLHRRVLATSVVLALLAPGVALAQTAKEKELEARVAQLERMVQQLVGQQQQTQATVTETQAQVSAVKTAQVQAPAAAPAAKAIQSTSILASGNPGGIFTYGGFIKFDAFVTDTSDGRIADGSAGRLFYVPSTIPVGGPGADGGDAYTDVHAQFSRFWFNAETITDNGDKFKAYIEADFFGGGSNALVGNENQTNTYAISLRQAYVGWNKWIAGQTWSNFQDTAALPDSVDFVGVTDGTIFVRQAQLRYTSKAWSFSAENPQTRLQNGFTTVNGVDTAAAQVSTGDNVLPDFTGRWITKGDWGHFTVAALARQFKFGNETENGYALSASGKFNLGTTDDIRYMANAGSGIGRYMAFGLGADTVLDRNGNLHALDGYGGFVAWRHVFSPQVRTNLMYSAAIFDNDTRYTGFGVTERAQSLHANMIYSPFPKLDIGAELSYGKRELEDNREGDLKRVHTSVKYSF